MEFSHGWNSLICYRGFVSFKPAVLFFEAFEEWTANKCGAVLPGFAQG
jgi:hypothetical protein